LRTDGIQLDFTDDAIQEIAEIASFVNSKAENIGARRLHTIMSKLLENLLFEAPDIESRDIRIDKNFVKQILKDIIEDEDLRKYIL